MALVFQYGSNLSTTRLNGPDRLDGQAQVVGVAKTVECFHLDYTVWSHHNNCAAADIVADASGRCVYGVVYEIPDPLVFGYHNHMTLDRIELEGESYRRQQVGVRVKGSDDPICVWTYRAKHPRCGLKTELDYVRHLLIGMKEHDLPSEYQAYVIERTLCNHSQLAQSLHAFLNRLNVSS